MNVPIKLEDSMVEALLSIVHEKNISKSQLAEVIGMPSATLRDILSKSNTYIGKKNHGILTDFLGNVQKYFDEHIAGDKVIRPQIRGVEIKLPNINLTGNEKPQIDSRKLQILLTQAKSGMDLVAPVLRELVNADVGSRMLFREFFQKDLEQLYIFVRAISNESMLEKVKSELGKSTI